jgi:hypothetical protein
MDGLVCIPLRGDPITFEILQPISGPNLMSVFSSPFVPYVLMNSHIARRTIRHDLRIQQIKTAFPGIIRPRIDILVVLPSVAPSSASPQPPSIWAIHVGTARSSGTPRF